MVFSVEGKNRYSIILKNRISNYIILFILHLGPKFGEFLEYFPEKVQIYSNFGPFSRKVHNLDHLPKKSKFGPKVRFLDLIGGYACSLQIKMCKISPSGDMVKLEVQVKI